MDKFQVFGGMLNQHYMLENESNKSTNHNYHWVVRKSSLYKIRPIYNLWKELYYPNFGSNYHQISSKPGVNLA